ncbi:hypothetical protein ACHAW5_007171 [Stephanodiscus triporus]|uniref:ADP,ATP carrier protein n=1 Tax=Stephanodiscus triporus TaxID=2934178 RepID=A0ABD3NZZ8_9STRA
MSQSVASEVVSAMVGGVFSASALYPLEVLKTRMQAETRASSPPSTSSVVVEPPRKGKKTAKEEEEDEEESSSEEEDVLPPPPSSSSSSSSKTKKDDNDDSDEMRRLRKQQRYSEAASAGMSSYAKLMYEEEGGIMPFYSGIVTSAAQSATEKALYFFAYTFYKNGYVGITGNPDIGPLPNLILGCLAEWSHLPVTLPIDCLTTAIQTDDKNRGAFALLSAMLSERGVGGFYKGIEAYVVLCLKPAIQYTVYEQVKVIILAARNAKSSSKRRGSPRTVDDGGDDGGGQSSSSSLGAAEAFFLGMFARVVATMLTYPYLRAKVMLQSTYGNAKVKPTIPRMIVDQISTGGVRGLYQGIGPELTRGVFSAALMMMVKERIGVIVRAFIEGARNDDFCWGAAGGEDSGVRYRRHAQKRA